MPVGLNTTRRGAALAADVAQGRLPGGARRPADLPLLEVSTTSRCIDIERPQWAPSWRPTRDAPVTFPTSDPDDLFMLIFTSGTSGEPKAVRVTHEKVAFPGAILVERFGVGRDDICYLSMPLFHSNA